MAVISKPILGPRSASSLPDLRLHGLADVAGIPDDVPVVLVDPDHV